MLFIAMLAPAQALTLKISTEYPDGNFVLKELRQAGDDVEKRTDGRIRFKFYPGGVMGNAAAVLRKIRIGQLHGAFIQSGALANLNPDSQVLNAPLLFRNFEEVDIVRAQLDSEIEKGYQQSGWHTFGLVEGGFAYAMTNKPATNLSVLREQKIWLPANDPLSEKIASTFKINPIVLNISDVLTALQTGAIDAIVAPPVGAIALQWHSKLGYLTDAPFMYTYGIVAVSEKALRKVSVEDLQILTEEFTAASQSIDQQARRDNLDAFDALQQLGIEVVNLSSQARNSIELEAQGATQELIRSGEFGSEIYQHVVDVLSEYRNE
ncbi:MAG: TRAP transporter substrate-binding protein DctP [Reinekea sp.]